MRIHTFTPIIAVLAQMAASGFSQAAIVASNLGEASVNEDSWGIFSGQWVGMSFTVGTASPLWNLDGVDIRATRAGLGNDFRVSLREDAGGLPGALIVILPGPDPDPAPIVADYHYSPAAPALLVAGNTYWLTIASTAGNYGWVYTDPLSTFDTGTDGWSIGNDVAISTNQGSSWFAPPDEPSKMAIHATAVPEPALAVSTAAAAAALLGRRRRAVTGAI